MPLQNFDRGCVSIRRDPFIGFPRRPKIAVLLQRLGPLAQDRRGVLTVLDTETVQKWIAFQRIADLPHFAEAQAIGAFNLHAGRYVRVRCQRCQRLGIKFHRSDGIAFKPQSVRLAEQCFDGRIVLICHRAPI